MCPSKRKPDVKGTYLSSISYDKLENDALYPVPVFDILIASNSEQDRTLLLDTQASVHIIANPTLLEHISPSPHPITVRGITRDITSVTLEGTLRFIGVEVYHSTSVAANILSYSRLQDTHMCTFKDDTFTAEPYDHGPTLTFTNQLGHYSLKIDTIHDVHLTSIAQRSSRFSKAQIQGARRAYDFLERVAFVSYKGAEQIVQRGSISGIGFNRTDLVNCQEIYGRPAAYIRGHGTNKVVTPGTDDPIPQHESVQQELQADVFYIFGQAFLLTVSVIMGLLMITHLGPIGTSSQPLSNKTRDQVGLSLLDHCDRYTTQGFQVTRVTSDGEPSIKAVRHQLVQRNIELNMLGHGSHAPHAESAIRHIKNKARSTALNLPYPLPSRWVGPLLNFVVHAINMVPRSNAPHHLSAYTSFTGRTPSYDKHLPHAFGTAGFLQRSVGPSYNSAQPRGEYTIWLGTTRNLAGTHLCFNVSTRQMMTGDTFRPTELTASAITFITKLSGQPSPDIAVEPPQPLLENPNAPYPLDLRILDLSLWVWHLGWYLGCALYPSIRVKRVWSIGFLSNGCWGSIAMSGDGCPESFVMKVMADAVSSVGRNVSPVII